MLDFSLSKANQCNCNTLSIYFRAVDGDDLLSMEDSDSVLLGEYGHYSATQYRKIQLYFFIEISALSSYSIYKTTLSVAHSGHILLGRYQMRKKPQQKSMVCLNVGINNDVHTIYSYHIMDKLHFLTWVVRNWNFRLEVG